MSVSMDFNPDWVSPPGHTLSDIMREKGLGVTELAAETGISEIEISSVVDGSSRISLSVAESLSLFLGTSKDFWLNRDKVYVASLDRQENVNWIQSLPYQSMAKNGWVPKTKNVEQKIRACLDFFAVDSVPQWFEEYDDLLHSVAFRTSKSFDSLPEATVAWLQKARLSVGLNQYKWCRDELRGRLDRIKRLSILKDPEVFIPKLNEELLAAGVSLVLLKCPDGCSASGATYFDNSSKPILLMSARYLSEDHFWFTLFHEIGHLLLHSNNGQVFIEGNCEESDEENEADDFARNVIIPEEYFGEFMSLNAKQWRNIPRFAKKVGVSVGVLVGQMQFFKLVPHNYFNKFKARYRWCSDSGRLLLK